MRIPPQQGITGSPGHFKKPRSKNSRNISALVISNLHKNRPLIQLQHIITILENGFINSTRKAQCLDRQRRRRRDRPPE